MIWRLTLATLAVWLAVSCASDERLTFRFDVGTTAVQRASFERAYPIWRDDAPTLPAYDPSSEPDGTWLVTFTDDISHHGHQVDGRTCRRVTEDCPIAHQIRIRSGFAPAITTAISAHEQGHALGLGHVADPRALMFEFSDEEIRSGAMPITLNETDRVECRRREVCPMIVVTQESQP